ncbi:glycosyltransferase family 4 protein [Seohaeicola saemankumensis]|uniref:glycosyltransferase family 4 protein n=1 Tax=Seohaeicola saemankumensis TaxID=481181 RepID=UPI001E53A936|nr:glycosyltransferase family 1 protein [Seohaeicola saemankumensis]MCD1627286.1 glycosyltransferase family 4 protein [Seohaeicola saemankumensis]
MRIVVDLQGAQGLSRYRGIGRYSLELALAVARNRGNHEVIIALSDMFPETIMDLRAKFHGVLPNSAIRLWTAPGPVEGTDTRNAERRKEAELIRETFIATLEPDVVLVTSLFEGAYDNGHTSITKISNAPTVVILYDLIPLMNSKVYLGDQNVAQWYAEKLSYLKKADHLLAISESVCQEAIEMLPWDQNKISNISAAANPSFKPLSLSKSDADHCLKKFGISKSFLMYTGGLDPRKNIKVMIAAFAALPERVRDNFQLAIVGKTSEIDRRRLFDIAKNEGLVKESLVVTGYVNDQELTQLYNLSTAFIFPSLHEGFGLPALEAMQCGKAVIASNTSSIPEVVGRKDAMFDPNDQSSLSEKIEKVLTDHVFRGELEEHGLRRSKSFSWDISAEKTIHELERVFSSRDDSQFSIAHEVLIDDLASALSRIASKNTLVSLADALAKTFVANKPVRTLYVDVSILAQHDAETGIQRVVRATLVELLNGIDGRFQVVPVRHRPDGRYEPACKLIDNLSKNKSASTSKLPIDPVYDDIFLGLDLDGHRSEAAKRELDRVHRWGVKVFHVVYDMLPIQLPEFFPDAKKWYEPWIQNVVSYDGAICISESVADDLRVWFDRNKKDVLPSFKVSWFHLGADICSTAPSSGQTPEANNILSNCEKRPTFLMVGTVEPRKGHRQVLKAFELLWSRGTDANLVIVGKEGWNVADLAKQLRSHPERGKRLFWPDQASDEFLEQIYAASTCLIAASEGEGFGLPLIEAAQHKLPIIARDIPVFREVAGDHASYFSGKDAENITTAVELWLSNWQNGLHVKSDHLPWLTWAQSAEQLMSVIEKWTAEGRK